MSTSIVTKLLLDKLSQLQNIDSVVVVGGSSYKTFLVQFDYVRSKTPFWRKRHIVSSVGFSKDQPDYHTIIRSFKPSVSADRTAVIFIGAFNMLQNCWPQEPVLYDYSQLKFKRKDTFFGLITHAVTINVIKKDNLVIDPTRLSNTGVHCTADVMKVSNIVNRMEEQWGGEIQTVDQCAKQIKRAYKILECVEKKVT